MKRGVDYIGVGVGALIFNSEGKIFMNKRGPQARNERGKWEFPGGSLEFNEKLIDGVKREIREEFDFEIEIIELLEVTDHMIPDEKQHWVSPTFIAKISSGTPKIMEPHKCTEIGWFNLEDIDKSTITICSLSNLNCYLEKFGHNPPKNM